MILFKELNLPQIPPNLIEIPGKTIIDVADIGYNSTHVKGSRVLTPCSYTVTHCNTDLKLSEWFANNIPGFSLARHALQQTATPPIGKIGTHIVHSDITRTFALNYFLSLGGDDAITSWYYELNKPMHRTKLSGGKQSDDGKVEYSNLIELASTKVKVNQWYLMAVSVLHDVDYIISPRTSISIGYTNSQYLLNELGYNDTASN